MKQDESVNINEKRGMIMLNRVIYANFNLYKRVTKVLLTGLLFGILTFPLFGQDSRQSEKQASAGTLEDFISTKVEQKVSEPSDLNLNKMISLHFKRVPLIEALKTIAAKGDLKLSYNTQLSSLDKFLTLNMNNVTIQEGLWKVLENTGLRFVIFPKRQLILMKNQIKAISQLKQETITGTVTDVQSGETLPGVNILVKGTTTGTSTDTEGSFELTVPSLQDTLIVSFVGYQTKEVPINGRAEINIQLVAQAIMGEEMVVVGYGEQRKQDLTGSVSTISASDFEQTPVTNPLDALQARSPGLNITSSTGRPGGGSEVLIRGVQSINGTNAPIFVVDGVITSDISYLSPQVIESVSVLKDASATSIYGARAANGVIIIKTKRGDDTIAPRISLNTQTGFQQNSNLQLNLLNADQFLELFEEAIVNADQIIPWSDNDIEKYEGVNTDWPAEMKRTGILQSYDLSVSGGSENSNYFISAGYQDNKGMVIGTDYQRYSLQFNFDQQISERIAFSNSISLYSSNTNGISGYFALASVQPPIRRAYEEDGDYGIIRNTSLEHNNNSPIWQARENDHRNQARGIKGNLGLSIELLEGLNFTTRGNIEWDQDYFTRFRPGVDPSYNWEGSPINEAEKRETQVFHFIGDFMLNYQKEFGSDHSLETLLGYSIEEYQREYLMASRTGTPNNQIRFVGAGDPMSMRNQNNFLDWAFLSIYGRLNYSYRDKYLFTGTVRRDGTSRLSIGNRYGLFPSASVAWRLSEENFLASSGFVNDLKLRASIGSVGNVQSISAYGTISNLNEQNYSANQQIFQGYTLADAVNEDLKWENTTKMNFGLDATVYEQHIYTTIDFFIEDTYDLLFNQPIPNSTGKAGSPFINAGQVRNSGIEMELGYRNTSKDWNYDVNFNFTHVKNEVIDLEGRDLRTSGIVEGYPVNSFFGYKSNGIIYDQETLGNNPQLEGKGIGDIWLTDNNGFDENGALTGEPDGIVNGADRALIGDRYPDFYYGLMGRIGFKSWNLQVQLQGVQGIDKGIQGAGNSLLGSANPGLFSYFTFIPRNHDSRVLDRFHETKNPDGAWPRLDASDQGRNLLFSEFWLRDASFLRIKNVNLSYQFSERFTNKLGLARLGMFITVQNLHTFTNWGGVEVDTNRDPLTGIPQPRTWALGLRTSL